MKCSIKTYDEQLTIPQADILCALKKKAFISQRMLAEEAGHSLGIVNRCLKELRAMGYMDDRNQLTEKTKEYFEECKPRNAVILAAGFGMRMVPINISTPKALIEVNGERLIERLIQQLQAVGIQHITVVVGFMKEYFEYLIDKYNVELVVNNDYASKNNLYSLYKAWDRLGNTYIVPCDIWCEKNPFSTYELYSWYMVSNLVEEESTVRLNRKMELVMISPQESGNRMVGISYLLNREADIVADNIKKLISDGNHGHSFWEEALYGKDRMILRAKVVHSRDAVEINTYEQLRELDENSNQLQNKAIRTIAEVLHCSEKDIINISVLKKGMTNRSFLFTVHGDKYIMRIPGEGTDMLINRENEAAVYRAISGLGLCDDPIYINSDNGYKITKYLENVRVCDSDNVEDLLLCMEKLNRFHEMDLKVSYSFDIFSKIEFYEKLWNGQKSIYNDYEKTKENVFSLKTFLDSTKKNWCLTHIDAVCDNFLFYVPEEGEPEQLQLTDWEYSGMQDPHVDLAMFCIYSLYNKKQTDRLIDIYFQNQCDKKTRIKIYCYIAVCGLLWSNWCEYKRNLGVEFGEYALRQYRYAKDYYRLVEKEVEK